MNKSKNILGIDASNLRAGGGVTHIIEILNEHAHENSIFEKFVIWGHKDTLSLIPDKFWLKKIYLNHGNFFSRFWWQTIILKKQLINEKCNILFSPGGSYLGNFRPYVTMSRNMLPFELPEIIKYGLSLRFFKLIFLRLIHAISMKRADGVIFLTNYAKEKIEKSIGTMKGLLEVIPHGISDKFISPPKKQLPVVKVNNGASFNVLYVSTIDMYKNQDNLVEAIAKIRKDRSWNIKLDLVGSSYPKALAKLNNKIKKHDPKNEWIKYHNQIPYSEINKIYHQSMLFAFLSSCENMPNILIESMSAGLPIICSNRGPMPEVLKDAGIYCDPSDPADIRQSIESLISDHILREHLSQKSFKLSQSYSWVMCSHSTFKFLEKFINRNI